MPTAKTALAVVISFILGAQIACVPSGFLGTSQSTSKSGPPVQKGEVAPEFDSMDPMDIVEKEVQEKLAAGDFPGIDEMAKTARQKKERLKGGYWKLDAIYNGLAGFFSDYKGQRINEEMWLDRIKVLQSWKANFPDSVTVRVALAEANIELGWYARGHGYADSVSDRDYQLFTERLGAAESELREAYARSMRCPRLYRELLSLGTATGWPTEEFDKIYDEAIEYEPNYFQVQLIKSEYVMPRWNGKPGDWQSFIDALPAKLSSRHSDESDMIYFLVAADKLRDQRAGNNWAMISTDRFQKGFAELDRKYGADRYRLNQFAYLSCVTRNLSSARSAFDRIGNDRDSRVWSEKWFKMMKEMAESDQGN